MKQDFFSDPRRLYSVEALKRYWPINAELIYQLPIPAQPWAIASIPPQTQLVSLPEWAYNLGVEGKMLVPNQCIAPGERPAWRRTDWLYVIFWYLTGIAEQIFEKQYGPIHSYSFRLKGWDSRLWERAWVNRIALFLRRWAARQQGINEETLFGPLPSPQVILTHDVDAITKTMAIRVKQAVFHTFNALRALKCGRFRLAFGRLTQISRFLFSKDDYWCFEQIMALEEAHQQRSHFNIYGGCGGWRRHPKYLLMDPAYHVNDEKLKRQLRQLHAKGWIIGLHQSFDAWADVNQMIVERECLEQALEIPITSCRQHWLRFSWEHTWQAQQEAGLTLDTTLGFNDRSAFRNGAALLFHPWDFVLNQPMRLQVLPMVLMDSHLYDYAELSDTQRRQQLTYWLDEIRFVGGTATIIWHQRVMSQDYGWAKGYQELLEYLYKS